MHITIRASISAPPSSGVFQVLLLRVPSQPTFYKINTSTQKTFFDVNFVVVRAITKLLKKTISLIFKAKLAARIAFMSSVWSFRKQPLAWFHVCRGYDNALRHCVTGTRPFEKMQSFLFSRVKMSKFSNIQYQRYFYRWRNTALSWQAGN